MATGQKVGFMGHVCIQFSQLTKKANLFVPTGGMTMPYLITSLQLKGIWESIGIFRFLKADQYSVKPTFALNTRVAERYPYLIDLLKERGDEILCHGLHMDALHYGGQDINEEREQVNRSLNRLRELSGQDIGWISPDRSESENTPELLVEHGVQYFCDWVNDDMPYQFKTANGEIVAVLFLKSLKIHLFY